MSYTVYMHVCPNGKKYIGYTGQLPVRRWGKKGQRYKGQPDFYKAILDAGWENIEHVIVAENLSKKEAAEMEKQLINLYNTISPNYGYNSRTGGDINFSLSEKTKQKIKATHTGMHVGEKNHQYGIPLSQNHKNKIKETRERLGYQPVNKKQVMNIDTGEIFESVAQAAKSVGRASSAIRRVCYGERITSAGYRWKYV